jgi:hypothetical protein
MPPCDNDARRLYSGMHHLIASIVLVIWTAANFFLWSNKQDQLILFWESLGMAAIAYPLFAWYVTRSNAAR